MLKDGKFQYKTSVRVNNYIKCTIENIFKEACKKTGLKLSHGQTQRAFWFSIAENPKFRKKCIELVCKEILEGAEKKRTGHYGRRDQSK